MPQRLGHRASICTGASDPGLVQEIQRLRRTIFVDRFCWDLAVTGDREVDQFDRPDTVHAAIEIDGRLVATFRAVRTDRPYLSAEVFPALAVLQPYPRRADMWEISRFGILPGPGDTTLARLNYAAMFWFARQVGATALVAIADLTYERYLRSLGIRTRRYGPPGSVGRDRTGQELRAVAGEIPVALQDPARIQALLTLLDDMEMTDARDVLGSRRVSA